MDSEKGSNDFDTEASYNDRPATLKELQDLAYRVFLLEKAGRDDS